MYIYLHVCIYAIYIYIHTKVHIYICVGEFGGFEENMIMIPITFQPCTTTNNDIRRTRIDSSLLSIDNDMDMNVVIHEQEILSNIWIHLETYHHYLITNVMEDVELVNVYKEIQDCLVVCKQIFPSKLKNNNNHYILNQVIYRYIYDI